MLEREADRARQHGEEQARRAEQRAEQLDQSAEQQQQAAEQQREAAEERAQTLTAQEELRRERREAEQAREGVRAELQEQETQETQPPVQPAPPEQQEAQTTREQELRAQQQEQGVQPEQQEIPPAPPTPVQGAAQAAVAELESPTGEPVAGTVVLSQTESGDGVALQATVAGLDPGRHEISIADASECEGAQQQPQAQAQPQQQAGQQPQQQERMPIGEIEVGPEGTAQFRALLDRVELAQGSQDSVIGRALLITDAAAGEPAACGIVESRQG